MERLSPFNSMHYERLRFSAQDVFNNDERLAGAPTRWIDILEGCVEATLPPRHETLIAEFAGEVEEETGRRFTKWSFLYDVNKNLTTKAFQEM